jgi:predicted  nucleic acid-binding Zn-ribbon protein
MDLHQELQASKERQFRLRERLAQLDGEERQSFGEIAACHEEMERKERVFKDILSEESERQEKAIEEYQSKLEIERNRLIQFLVSSRTGHLS